MNRGAIKVIALAWVRATPVHVLLPSLLLVLHAGLFFDWLVDDAGISFSYARNLAHGHGLVAQAGSEPVEGFSNPLWTLLTVPFFAGEQWDPTIPIKVLSLVLVVASFGVVGAICQRLLPGPWWSRMTAGATSTVAASSTGFVVWTTSGLENPLYVLLSVTVTLLAVVYGLKGSLARRGAVAAAGAVTAGLALTRPDGILYFSVFSTALLLRWWREGSAWRQRMADLFLFLGVAGVPLILYQLFRMVYFGDVLPNTYVVKGGASLADVQALALGSLRDLVETYELFEGLFGAAAGLALAIALVGLGTVWVRRPGGAGALLVLPAVLTAWSAYVLLPPDWMGELRFATPFFILFPLAAFLALAFWIRQVGSVGLRKPLYCAIVVGWLLHSASVNLPRSFSFAEDPTVSLRDVAVQAIRFNQYADLLEVEEATFLGPDMGGFLMFSEHRVFDLVGLCDRKIARLKAEPDRGEFLDYVLEDLEPTFVHVHGFWSVESGLFLDPRFRERYEPICESPFDRAPKMMGRNVFFDGDYVLKKAVGSVEALKELRRRRDAGGSHHRGCEPQTSVQEARRVLRGARPFPRG